MDNKIQKIRYLYGVTTQPEFLNFVRTQCVNASEDDIPLLLDKWRKSVARFIEITQKGGYLPEDNIVEDIPPEFRQKIV